MIKLMHTYLYALIFLGGIMTDFEDNVLDGVVEEIIFENDDTGYRVFSVNCDGILHTAVFTGSTIFPGESITASGEWKTHASYGRQFVCEEIDKNFPYEIQGMLKFLSSGAVKGIGPATAQKIVEKFGESSFYILENEPDKLCQIRGISREKADIMSASFKTTLGIRDIMIQLNEYNISPNIAVKIYNRFGGFSLEIISTDPYRLWEEIEGFSFNAADDIALENGLAPDSDLRLSYFIKYILTHNLSNGHSFLPLQKLAEIAASNVGVETDYAVDFIDSLATKGELVKHDIGAVNAVYLPQYFEAENYIAQKLYQIEGYSALNAKNIDLYIDKIEKQLAITYALNQREAINLAYNNNAMVLTGGPGTGKTTTLNGILKLFDMLGLSVCLCAPTGRAARRLSEVCGREAKTIHRLLEVDVLKQNAFVKNEANPIKADVVIVDEMSMVDVRLFEALLRAIVPTTRLIMVGDADQLPSVGAGNVFLDIIKSQNICTVFLNEVFRQATASKIVVNAHKINKGEQPDLTNSSDFFFIKKSSAESINDAIATLVSERIPNKYNFTVTSGLQVISPSKKTLSGTQAINEMLRDIVNKKSDNKTEVNIKNRIYRVGDKVMQIKNNYDITCKKSDDTYESGIFNGDIGIITSIDTRNRQLNVQYDDRVAVYDFSDCDQLELAYAITVHKSQGSEFEAVLLVINDITQLLQYRNLLYTAVTRAKQLLIIVGSDQVIENMVNNSKRNNRYSGLKSQINAYFKLK